MPVLATFPVTRVVAQDTWPVISTDDAKAFLAIPADDSSRDSEIEAFVEAAVLAVEEHCHITIRDTTVVISTPVLDDAVRIEERPFRQVEKIEYVRAGDGEILTIPASTYHVQPLAQATAAIVLGEGAAWPDDDAVRHDAFRITAKIGFEAAELVPKDIRQAILMMVAKLDANRGDCGCEDGGQQSVYAMKNAQPTALPTTAALLVKRWIYHRVTFA